MSLRLLAGLGAGAALLMLLRARRCNGQQRHKKKTVLDLEEKKRKIAQVTKYFPFKGIERFYDISGFLQDPEAFQYVLDVMVAHYSEVEFDSICGIDARGFLLGAPLALALKKPFFMGRKEGKLPNSVVGQEYGKEYAGMDRLCMSVDAVKPGDRVVVFDDLIATGGTAIAMIDLIQDYGAKVVSMGCVIELKALNARHRMNDKGLTMPIFSILEETHFP